MKMGEKKSSFDRMVDSIQNEIIEQEREIFSKKVIDEYNNPHNFGRMQDPDASGILTGPCGDTMVFYLKLDSDKVLNIMFLTDGCGPTVSCGSMLTKMVRGKSVIDAEKVSKEDLIEALDGLPEENLHCAALAVNALKKAINGRSKVE